MNAPQGTHRYQIWNWAESENEFRKALAANNDYSTAHYWYASLLGVLGRREESITEAIVARDLDPFSPLVHVNLARVYYYARQFDASWDVLAHARETGIEDTKIKYMQGLILLQQNKPAEALPIFKSIYTENRLFAAAPLGCTYARLGKLSDARAIISELGANPHGKAVVAQEIAAVLIGMDKTQEAVSYLEQAVGDHHPALVSLKVEPLYDKLRQIPRFKELLSKMQLNDK